MGYKGNFDIVSCLGTNDINIAEKTIKSLNFFLKPSNIYIISSKDNLIFLEKKYCFSSNIYLIDEDTLIPEIKLNDIKIYLKKRIGNISRSGWYFQQFLKMYACHIDGISKEYLIWDIDTVLLRKLDYVSETGKYIFYKGKKALNQAYFETIENLLGIKKVLNFSFISENLIVNKIIMQKIILIIKDKNKNKNWVFNILNSIEKDNLLKSGFSEFETYGTYISNFHKDQILFKKIKYMKNTYTFFGMPNCCLTYIGLYLNGYAWASFETWDKKRNVNFFIKLILNLIRIFNKDFSRLFYKGILYLNLDLKIINRANFLARDD